MSQYFPPYRGSGKNIKVEVDLSSYATKTDLKNVTHADASSFASKANLANLKTEVYKIDVDKLKTVSADLAKLSNVVKNDVVKITEYDKLVTKVDNIDFTGFVLKTKYDLEKKISDMDIPDINGLVKKTNFNSKNTEIENKTASISNLATNPALTAIENKIPNVSSLVKKKHTNYNTKISEIEKKVSDHNHDKYITTPKFNKLIIKSFKARLAQADLVTKTNFDTKLQDFSE